jgi:hypothetical protein
MPHTTYKSQPVNLSAWVNETVMMTEPVTSYKPVWTREKRERRTTVLKPIVQTSEKVERYLVKRPVWETTYEERQIEETSYETVTEMQEQRYLVQKPVVETELREEHVLVRKPVTTTMMQTENVTTLKPVTVAETQYVAGMSLQNDLVLQTGRNRLRWLSPGYYVDPLTGWTDFRRRGLHWVPDQTLALQPTVAPTLTPQTVLRTSYEPETVQVQKPVQVTQYVEQVETRKVPVEVTKTSSEIQIVRTPVTVQKPVTRIRTEKVPVQTLNYKEEILVRKVPVTETTYQRVEQVEPYDVEVCRWVAETKQVAVPRTVTRRVDYSIDRLVPETTWLQVPVNHWGQVVSKPIVPSSSLSLLAASEEPQIVIGEPMVVRKLAEGEVVPLLEGTQKPAVVEVGESQSVLNRAQTELVDLQRPAASGSSRDDGEAPLKLDGPIRENAADTQPSLQVDSENADIDTRPDDETN